jgi:hypothetical protein
MGHTPSGLRIIEKKSPACDASRAYKDRTSPVELSLPNARGEPPPPGTAARIGHKRPLGAVGSSALFGGGRGPRLSARVPPPGRRTAARRPSTPARCPEFLSSPAQGVLWVPGHTHPPLRGPPKAKRQLLPEAVA